MTSFDSLYTAAPEKLGRVGAEFFFGYKNNFVLKVNKNNLLGFISTGVSSSILNLSSVVVLSFM